MRKVTFHEEADSGIYEAALHYEGKAADLGLLFLDEIEKAILRILANPMAYPSIGDEVRQAIVSRFPYSILYTIESDEHLRVIAAAHQKRRPRYWKVRR